MNIDLRTKQGWEHLKRILDDRVGDVLALCGMEMPKRNGWTLLDDPRGDGRECFGLSLRADGLAWKKFNGTEKGRALELIAYCHGWYHLEKRGADQAANLAMQRLGLAQVSAEQLARDRAAAKAKRAQAEADSHSRRDKKSAAAFASFASAKPILGTVGEIYLRQARGIDLRAAPFIGPRGGNISPGSLRLAPWHRYLTRDKIGTVTGELFAPAMLACCTDPAGQIRAVHQTWLSPHGVDKAVIAPAPDGTAQPSRKVLGEFAGLVIPLWRGDGHLSVKDASANGLLQTLILTEGVEDGLSAVLAAPQHRVWAMISLSNMVNVAERLTSDPKMDCIESVIVHRQNDWDKPSAVAAFDRGLAALRNTGRLVAEVAAASGKDLNDTLRSA
jgi:Toprim domain